MAKLDYEPQQPPRKSPPAKTLIYLALACSVVVPIFFVWGARTPSSSTEPVCYTFMLGVLALFFVFMAWRSYYEHRP